MKDKSLNEEVLRVASPFEVHNELDCFDFEDRYVCVTSFLEDVDHHSRVLRNEHRHVDDLVDYLCHLLVI